MHVLYNTESQHSRTQASPTPRMNLNDESSTSSKAISSAMKMMIDRYRYEVRNQYMEANMTKSFHETPHDDLIDE